MDADKIQAILEQANQLLESGKAAETLACLDGLPTALLDSDDRIELASLRSWALAELGRFDDALDEIEDAIDEEPDSARLHSTRGVVLSNAGDLEEARDALELAFTLDEGDHVVLANLALVYEKLREFEYAADLYDRALTLGADIDWSLQRKAAVQTELGDMHSAEQTLKRYLSLVPDDAEAWVTLGILYSDDERFEAAFQAYRHSEMLWAENPNLRLNWGVTAVRAGAFDVARQQLQGLRQLEPKSSRPRLLHAFLLEETGDSKAAHVAYQDALQRVRRDNRQEAIYAYEMAMDFFSRQQMAERCERLFERAYADNACTVELCEAYRSVIGPTVPEASWYSVTIEGRYRPGLVEIPEGGRRTRGGFMRFLRNFQVVARNHDDALDRVLTLARKMGEQDLSVREFIGSEGMQSCHLGVYEVEAETLVFSTGATASESDAN